MIQSFPVEAGGDCPGFCYTLSLIAGKYKMIILFRLWKAGTARYNEIRRSIAGISHKMLSRSLKELEADGLIVRTEYPQVPPKVDYRLSERGLSLLPVLRAMCEWGERNRICRSCPLSKAHSASTSFSAP